MATSHPTPAPAPGATGPTRMNILAGCAGCLAWPLLLIGLMCTQATFAGNPLLPLLTGLAAGLAGVPLLIFAWKKGRLVDRVMAAVAAPLALLVIGEALRRLR